MALTLASLTQVPLKRVLDDGLQVSVVGRPTEHLLRHARIGDENGGVTGSPVSNTKRNLASAHSLDRFDDLPNRVSLSGT